MTLSVAEKQAVIDYVKFHGNTEEGAHDGCNKYSDKELVAIFLKIRSTVEMNYPMVSESSRLQAWPHLRK